MDKGQQLREFDLIARFFVGIGPAIVDGTTNQYGVDLSIGDDCALLNIPADHQLAFSIDTLIAGRHFPTAASAFDIGQRALAVSVSDLAAMGAKPMVFTLAISLPAIDTDWLEGFSAGLNAAAEHYAIPLVGGDTTQGPLSLTLQVQGSVAKGLALKRSGAKLGDFVYVSGHLGDAAAALAVIEESLANQSKMTESHREYLLARFYQPQARVDLGQALLGVANSAIDVSDGLMADLKHIATASSVAAHIDSQCLPLSAALIAVSTQQQAIDFALVGGDDYELCFTAAADKHQQIMDISQQLNIPISKIGHITSGSGVHCVDGEGQQLNIDQAGYQHFS
jgi:thiamine-monophosphate kinase